LQSMVDYQIRRRRELQAWAAGQLRDAGGNWIEPPGTAIVTKGVGSRGNTDHLFLEPPK
jgi:hypothetical protein